MKFSKHITGLVCPGCEERLAQANVKLCDWFHYFKQQYSRMHVSWAYRDEDSQNAAYADGASLKQWPDSKHNTRLTDGTPYACALDIFQLDAGGKAIFDPIFCARINDESKKAGYSLRWGGEFKSLGDAGHFELS